MVNAAFAEVVLQHRQNRHAPFGIQPAGQSHVKAEFLEDVGISPLLEIVTLSRGQLRGIAPGAIVIREWRAKRVEIANTICGEGLEIGATRCGYDGSEA